jgi:hypothetical protein
LQSKKIRLASQTITQTRQERATTRSAEVPDGGEKGAHCRSWSLGCARRFRMEGRKERIVGVGRLGCGRGEVECPWRGSQGLHRCRWKKKTTTLFGRRGRKGSGGEGVRSLVVFP